MNGTSSLSMALGHTGNVLLTGYWPPTNEMLRQLSNDPSLNPGGWNGRNWRGLGFDVYAYFPEFETDPPTDPGVGTFRVHYGDTSRDWQRITSELAPVAIITFSLGDKARVWELEDRATNHSNWVELKGSGLPSPSPPDDTVPAETVRFSSLPMHEIVSAVGDLDLEIDVAIDDRGGGKFLSEYISYHGLWYRAEHVSCSASHRCIAAGHVHVGPGIEIGTARKAVEATLQATLLHVRQRERDCLSVVRISRFCLEKEAPLSVAADVIGAGAAGSGSLRQGLNAILDGCE